jgi:glutathione S-transferase
MDSRAISERIEGLYPTPSARLDSLALSRLYDLIPRLVKAIQPIYLLRVPQRVLNEASQEYWYRTRGQLVGMPVEEFAAKNPEKECWDRAEEVIKEVTALLKQGGDGPFFLGKEVSYADFVWGGLLIFLKRQGEDGYQELLKRSGDGEAHERFLKALEPWTKRDSE